MHVLSAIDGAQQVAPAQHSHDRRLRLDVPVIACVFPRTVEARDQAAMKPRAGEVVERRTAGGRREETPIIFSISPPEVKRKLKSAGAAVRMMVRMDSKAKATRSAKEEAEEAAAQEAAAASASGAGAEDAGAPGAASSVGAATGAASAVTTSTVEGASPTSGGAQTLIAHKTTMIAIKDPTPEASSSEQEEAGPSPEQLELAKLEDELAGLKQKLKEQAEAPPPPPPPAPTEKKNVVESVALVGGGERIVWWS